jgi:hypothetical protein
MFLTPDRVDRAEKFELPIVKTAEGAKPEQVAVVFFRDELDTAVIARESLR